MTRTETVKFRNEMARKCRAYKRLRQETGLEPIEVVKSEENTYWVKASDGKTYKVNI